jgi:Acyl-CoA reductase (LuxC)
MDLQNRICAVAELGGFMQSSHKDWINAKSNAFQHNPWFVPEFIDLSVDNIVRNFLNANLLKSWLEPYDFSSNSGSIQRVGIVMAGNIPLVGFHDFLCCLLSGHQQTIKLSSKDAFLFPVIINFLKDRYPEFDNLLCLDTLLRGLDAYIATGSSNSARYFDYYFGKYPSLIRRNKTSVAILSGDETIEELERLADDVFLFFGLGCRNVTKIFIPEGYDFVPLLKAFKKYKWMANHNKYKNNYDYRLSLAILNKLYYMTNDCILLLENESDFSPISVLHYAYYRNNEPEISVLKDENLQIIVGRNHTPFGISQQPKLADYADNTDTMKFLRSL